MINDPSLLSFLGAGHPARLTASKTAKLLGFAGHDVPVLVASGLLKPLGNPSPNSPKFFALVEVLAQAADRDWLNKATRTLSKHWQKKNDEQRGKRAERVRAGADDGLVEEPKSLSAELSATSGKKEAAIGTNRLA